MVVIDFKDTKKQAFIKGFYKGIAAPLMLFGSFTAPPLPEVKPIIPPHQGDEQALNGDWKTIGLDFNNAITKYGQESSKSN